MYNIFFKYDDSTHKLTQQQTEMIMCVVFFSHYGMSDPTVWSRRGNNHPERNIP